MAGLAPDGGLFMPARIPAANIDEAFERAGSSFAEMAGYLAGLFFAEDLDRVELEAVAREAFDFEVPLVHIDGGMHASGLHGGGGLHTLELFHGPTAAFKDFGAGFMGRMLSRLMPDNQRLVVLTATSGDTGSAVAHGFHGVDGIDVVVLYPDGKISDLQESQMTTLGGNIHPLRVSGTFDDCQRMVKEVFADGEFRARHNVTSANSINLLRWIPQTFHYFWGAWLWSRFSSVAPTVVVPSGNYGNLSAGMLARRMGLEINGFVAASNANDVVPEWLRTGIYSPRPSVRTVANAMDVGVPNNYERMLAMAGGIDALREEIAGWASSDDDIRRAIKELYDKYGYVSDPHSAAGYAAAVGMDVRGFWLSTASPAKFGEVIEPVIGVAPEIPERLARLIGRSKIFTPMEPDSARLKDFVSAL